METLILLYIASFVIYQTQLIKDAYEIPPFGFGEWTLALLFFIGGFVPVFNTIIAIRIVRAMVKQNQ